MRLRDLPGLGPKSEEMLATIGITSPSELQQLGPVRAFMMLKKRGVGPSLNLLYAMTGALSGKDWREIARSQKTDLLLELDGFEDLRRIFAAEGIELEI